MLIQCFIEKADGSPVFVDFEGVRYVFQKNQFGDAVAFVSNQRHIERLKMMGSACYKDYEPPEPLDPAGNIFEVGSRPIPLGNVQRQRPEVREPLPDNLSVDEALGTPDERDPAGPLASTVEVAETTPEQITEADKAQDAANETAAPRMKDQREDHSIRDQEKPVEIEWAPEAVDAKTKEFRTLSDVNFISFLAANKERIMNWPLEVRGEIAKKIRNKLPAYNPEAEGIEGFKIDDYIGGGSTGDS